MPLLRSFEHYWLDRDYKHCAPNGAFRAPALNERHWRDMFRFAIPLSSIGAPCEILSMANTYTQSYLHVVFAVSGRTCVTSSEHREELQKYITGIVTGKGEKLIATLLHARSHTSPARSKAQHRPVRFGWRHQNRIDQSYQRTQTFVLGRTLKFSIA
jgi:hypothetical protein